MSVFLVYWRAILKANSFASVPPVVKKTRSVERGDSVTSRSARSTRAGVVCRPETCVTLPS
jgi:hypothetical protein